MKLTKQARTELRHVLRLLEHVRLITNDMGAAAERNLEEAVNKLAKFIVRTR